MSQSPTASTMPRSARQPGSESTVIWSVAGALAVLFAWLHWEFLYRSTLAAVADPNWSHIAVVPFISAYYVFLNRDRLAELHQRLFWPGLVVVFLGLFSYVWWIYPGRNDMFRGYSMILTLFGVVLFTLGPAKMRVLWFPIAYMAFAVKIPDSIWERIAFQLTIVASVGAEVMLNIASQLLDFHISKDGQSFRMMWMEDGKLIEHGFDVAGACSGLRMLMAFCALGVALAFLWDRTWWQRAIMILMAVPIAVGVNIARVTVLGLLNLVNPELAQGDFHIAVGMLMLIPAAIIFLGLGKLLDMMVIEGDDDHNDPSGGAASGDGSSAATGPAGSDGETAPSFSWGRLLPWFAGGMTLAVLLGLIYVLLLNAVSANPIVEQLNDPASIGIAAALAVALVLVFLALRGKVRGLLGGLVLVTGFTLASAVGLQSVVAATEVALIKQSVDMRHGFYALPQDVGPWKLVGQDEPLDPYIEDELGTQDYITRYYRDTRLPEDDKAAVARVHLAYYTGMIDTVPHVPDRCWVAGGITPGAVRSFELRLDLPNGTPDEENGGVIVPVQIADPVDGRTTARLPGDTVPLRSFTGINPQTGDEVRASYFFVANGGYYASSNDVRLLGFDPRDKFSYYCKVEVSFPSEDDEERSDAQTAALLSDLLPEIMACLPDWADVRAGRWPVDERRLVTPTPAPAADPAQPPADAID